MRVGIVILADQPWSVARRRWQAAEEYGFDHAWTYDHLGWRTWSTARGSTRCRRSTAAALVTSRIRLGTMVASPNFRHPVHFAREVTALDDLAGGRLVLGLGRRRHRVRPGGARRAGADRAPQRARRFAEFVELLDLVLRAPGR